jgi:hypothetical protein
MSNCALTKSDFRHGPAHHASAESALAIVVSKLAGSEFETTVHVSAKMASGTGKLTAHGEGKMYFFKSLRERDGTLVVSTELCGQDRDLGFIIATSVTKSNKQGL